MLLCNFINDFNPFFCWSAGFPIGTLSNIPSEFHFGKNSVVSREYLVVSVFLLKIIQNSFGILKEFGSQFRYEEAADFVYLRGLILFLK